MIMVQLGHSTGKFPERMEFSNISIMTNPVYHGGVLQISKFSVLVIIIIIKQAPGEGQDNTIPNWGRVILFSALHWGSAPHPPCCKILTRIPNPSNFTLSLNKAMHPSMLWTSFPFDNRSFLLYVTLRILRCLLSSLSEDKQRNLDQQTGLYFNNLQQYTVLLIALKETSEFGFTFCSVRGKRIIFLH